VNTRRVPSTPSAAVDPSPSRDPPRGPTVFNVTGPGCVFEGMMITGNATAFNLTEGAEATIHDSIIRVNKTGVEAHPTAKVSVTDTEISAPTAIEHGRSE
jgi:hypothetical protein